MAAVAPAGRESQKAYLAKRDARIEDLFLREGYESRDIAALMLANGTLRSDSVESAERTVRSVVAKIRARLDIARKADAQPTFATNDIDALERKLKRLREDLAFQNMVAAGQPTENCARSGVAVDACANEMCALSKHVSFIGPAVGVIVMNTPQGPMTTYKALWPAGVRQKAKKDASALTEKIAELEITLASKRVAEEEKGIGTGDGGLTIIESDKSIAELIQQNGIN